LISRGNAKVTKFVPRSLIATALAAREHGELRCDLTGTFYPDANPETTTHDGQISNTTDPELWSTKNTESTGDAVDDSAQTCLQQCFTSTTTNRWGVWYRMFAGFDLASISGATVSAVDFTLTSAVVTKIETLASQTLSVAQMTPGSWTAAATSDWGIHCNATTRMASDINWSSIADNGAANTFSFNSTGISAVQTAAGSRFGLSMKNGSELDNAEPTWLSNKRTRITWQTAEVAGTGSDPKLVVTYTAGGGGTGNNLLLLSVG
jgi:hypothetical protein